MAQQIKSKYNKFNHNFYMLWDFIKSTFVKVKKNPIENTTPISIMSFNLRRDTTEDKMNCWQYRKDAVVDLPPPFGPVITSISPSATSKLISSIIFNVSPFSTTS